MRQHAKIIFVVAVPMYKCLRAQVKLLRGTLWPTKLACLDLNNPSKHLGEYKSHLQARTNGPASADDLGNVLVAGWIRIPTVTLPYLVEDLPRSVDSCYSKRTINPVNRMYGCII